MIARISLVVLDWSQRHRGGPRCEPIDISIHTQEDPWLLENVADFRLRQRKYKLILEETKVTESKKVLLKDKNMSKQPGSQLERAPSSQSHLCKKISNNNIGL